MQRHLRTVSLGIFLIAGLTDCTSDAGNEVPGGATPGTTCSPGAVAQCSCGTSVGSTSCSAAATWGQCACTSPSLTATGDGGVSSVGTGSSGSAGGLDAGAVNPGSAPAQSTGNLPCDVSAVLASNCASCHGAKTEFGAPMSLVTWDDLNKAAPITKGRITRELALERMKSDARPMPPAPHPRASAADIATLEKWIAGGAPKGTQTCTAPSAGGGAGTDGGTASTPANYVPKPDDCESTFELKAHGGTGENDNTKFKISANPTLEGNQYHCFYFKPPYAADSGLLWFDSILDNTANLHHWILYATDNATHASGTSAPCNAAEPGAYFVVGWAPGANNTVVAKDVSLKLPSGPNAGLILEVHYYNDTKKEQQDASGVRFCTAKTSKRAHTAGISSLGSEGICVPPNTKSFDVTGGCDPRDDMGDIHIIGVWPHMHKLARRSKVVIKRKGGGEEVIHDMPFDFNSQIFYPKDVVLHPGDSIENHCFYDNDSNTQVKFGERTQDEMCYAFTLAWPAGALVNQALFGTGAAGSSVGVNRCADDLSVLKSCNGVADAPMTVTNP